MFYDLSHFLCLFVVFYEICPLLYFVHAPPLTTSAEIKIQEANKCKKSKVQLSIRDEVE
jgi:hypothetical protein